MCRLHLVVALAGLGLSGCWNLDFRYDKRGVHEDTGPVVVGSAAPAVAFSADGSELFYGAVRPDQPSSARVELHAIRLADRLERVIDERPMEDLAAITVLPDGSAVYYVAVVDGGHYRLREALSATDVTLDSGPGSGGVMAFSRDLEKLYVDTQRGGVVLDRGTGVELQTPCRWEGAAFSPAGDELVCQRWDEEYPSPIIRFRLADQAQTPLPGVEGCLWARAFRWNTAGIAVAYPYSGGGRGPVVVGDPQSGARLASVDEGTNAVDLQFTVDGRALVMAETECLAGELFGCSRYEYRLQVLDLATRHRTFIASSAGGLGGFDVSPDGTAIAYTFADPSSDSGMGWPVHLRPTAR